jgi:competence protein ComEA
MLPALREAASRVVARVMGSRFAKPLTRVALAGAGLFVLAFIGKSALAGAMGTAAADPLLVPSAVAAVSPAPPAAAEPAAAAIVAAPPAAPSPTPTAPSGHGQATPDDPVFLNTANVDDLRRLPGVGEKRASAIMGLRTRMGGRFHAIEDLLKVKGIGRATLRRLRPLVRLDPPPTSPPSTPDGGTDEPPR